MQHLQLFHRLLRSNADIYFLKIVTLAIALASTVLILVFAWGEFGYDEFHHNATSVVRIIKKNENPSFEGNRLSDGIARKAFQDFRLQLNDSIRLSRVKAMDQMIIQTDSQKVVMDHIHAADDQITSVLRFDLIDGSVENFHEQKTVLLSASAARRLLGDTKVSGKKINVLNDDTLTFTVAGVFTDYPKNASERLDIVLKYDSTVIHQLGFTTDETRLYGRLLRGSSLLQLEAALNRIQKGADTTLHYRVQPLPSIYFGPRVTGEGAKHGDYYSVLILLCIAAFIFLLAITNFVNLTTLTLPKRSKELGIRKIAGGTPWHLVSVLCHESFYVSFISLVLALLALFFTSAWIHAYLSVDITAFIYDADFALLLSIVSLFVLIGIAPLWMSLRFVRASAGRLLSTEAISFPRFKRNITIIQLGISISLIIAGLVIKRQISYSLIKEPGLNYDQVVYVRYPEGMTTQQFQESRNQWKKNPNIMDVTAISALPDHVSGRQLDTRLYYINADYSFRDFFHLQMVKGRWYGPNDMDSMVVNQKAIRQGRYAKHVIGVVEDFGSMFNQSEKPMVVQLAPSSTDYHFICFRVLEVDIRKTIGLLSTDMQTRSSKPGPVSFMNKSFEDALHYEDRLNSFSELLTIISGIIACCAIYSLSLSRARDKQKQIAIHKIMGASTLNIIFLLVAEFVQQLLIAILFFGPCIYLFLKEWLRNFVYAADFNWSDPLISLGYCTSIVAVISLLQVLRVNKVSLVAVLKQHG